MTDVSVVDLSIALRRMAAELRLLGGQVARLERELERERAQRKPRSRPGAWKTDRNAALVDAYRTGSTVATLTEVYGITHQRVYQILKAAGEDLQTALAERRLAARQVKLEARMTPCRVCGGEFVKRGNTCTCSPVCADAWRLGRRYLDPAHYEQHRRYVKAGGPPNRRYARPNSAVVRALIAAGRTDVLPPRRDREAPRPPCAATNVNGTSCNRHAAPGDSVCHIHRAIRDGNPISRRSAS